VSKKFKITNILFLPIIKKFIEWVILIFIDFPNKKQDHYYQ
jgi:hypothetical protein